LPNYFVFYSCLVVLYIYDYQLDNTIIRSGFVNYLGGHVNESRSVEDLFREDLATGIHNIALCNNVGFRCSLGRVNCTRISEATFFGELS